jgi:hypothetical protein
VVKAELLADPRWSFDQWQLAHRQAAGKTDLEL